MSWAGPLFEGHKCSIGYEVLDWVVTYCCHGVGDIQGKPISGDYDLDDEIRDFFIDAYEIDPVTGRRVRNEAVFSRAKGRAKSENAGFIAVAEAFAPVRFSHWDEDGQPVGRKVTSPLIKCLATEEGQAGNTFQNVAYIVEWGQDHFPEIYGNPSGFRNYQAATSIWLPDGGEIRACSSGAASKDGGLETFVVADETHLYVLPELQRMYATISRNLGKRYDADSWLMQTSTAYKPGEGSVFEKTLTMWRKGQLPPSVLVNHRQAKGKVDLDDKARTMRQLHEAYGAAAAWIDLERKYRDMRDPRICKDDEEAARYFLNMPLSSKDVWIPAHVVERQELVLFGENRRGLEVMPEGTEVTLGFDGSLNDDSTVLVASRLSDGYLWPIEIWEKPEGPAGNFWEVPRLDVVEMIKAAYRRFDVKRGYFDPHEWRSDVDSLAETFGEERVLKWDTSSWTRSAGGLDLLRTDLMQGGPDRVWTDDNGVEQRQTMGKVFHSGDPVFIEHFTNAYVRMRGTNRLIRKEHDQSDRKIDSVMGAMLAYEARRDVLTEKKTEKKQPSISHRVYGFS